MSQNTRPSSYSKQRILNAAFQNTDFIGNTVRVMQIATGEIEEARLMGKTRPQMGPRGHSAGEGYDSGTAGGDREEGGGQAVGAIKFSSCHVKKLDHALG